MAYFRDFASALIWFRICVIVSVSRAQIVDILIATDNANFTDIAYSDVPEVQFYPSSGVFSGPFGVVLSVPSTGIYIKYTLDNSIPTIDSLGTLETTGGLFFTDVGVVVINAIAIRRVGGAISNTTTAAYTLER